MRDKGGERVVRWGWGPTSLPNAFSICVSATSGMGSDTKINNLLTWPSLRMMLIVTVNQPQARVQEQETFPCGGGEGASQPLFWKFPHIIPLLEERKLRATERT